MNKEDFSSTQKIVWEDKSGYYDLLKDKVKTIIALRNK
jgi:hypothetical protein